MITRLLKSLILMMYSLYGTVVASNELPIEIISSGVNERNYVADAHMDASINYPGIIDKTPAQCEFILYKGFSSDLDRDGNEEIIVSGSLNEKLTYVMVYYMDEGKWTCNIVNSCNGGSVFDIKIIDVDNDGFAEIYSVLLDENLRRFCRIEKLVDHKFTSLFSLDTRGGLLFSCNISLMRADEKQKYRVRIDEVEYPEKEDGDVRQRTYFYKLEKNIFVLENVYSGRQ
ncbi:VCBS repeat-containing protein [bacterium]|nr:VCBS repeat-containing protein [bacterium]